MHTRAYHTLRGKENENGEEEGNLGVGARGITQLDMSMELQSLGFNKGCFPGKLAVLLGLYQLVLTGD